MSDQKLLGILQKKVTNAIIGEHGVYTVPKDVAKGLKAKAKAASCKSGRYMYKGKCMHLEEVLFECGSPGITVGKTLQCGGTDITLPAFDKTMKAEMDVFRLEHNIRVKKLEAFFKKRIAEWRINAETEKGALDYKAQLLKDNVVMKKSVVVAVAFQNIDQQKELAKKSIQSKIEENALKLEQAMSFAFSKLENDTIKRLDQRAKTLNVFIYADISHGRLAGLKKSTHVK